MLKRKDVLGLIDASEEEIIEAFERKLIMETKKLNEIIKVEEIVLNVEREADEAESVEKQ